MTESEVRAIVEETICSVWKRPDVSIDGMSSLEELDGWDSMLQVQLVIELEDQLSIAFPEDDLEALVELDLLVSSIQAELGSNRPSVAVGR